MIGKILLRIAVAEVVALCYALYIFFKVVNAILGGREESTGERGGAPD